MGKDDLLKKTVAEIERHIIESALRRAKGNGREAAKQLGTTHRILMYRIKKYSIDIETFRPARSKTGESVGKKKDKQKDKGKDL